MQVLPPVRSHPICLFIRRSTLSLLYSVTRSGEGIYGYGGDGAGSANQSRHGILDYEGSPQAVDGESDKQEGAEEEIVCLAERPEATLVIICKLLSGKRGTSFLNEHCTAVCL